jgi:hypothetical protein
MGRGCVAIARGVAGAAQPEGEDRGDHGEDGNQRSCRRLEPARLAWGVLTNFDTPASTLANIALGELGRDGRGNARPTPW